MMKKLFLIALILFSSFQSLAAVEILNVIGTSEFDDEENVIFGGVAGDLSLCSSATETCNTCQDDTLERCNFDAVHDNLTLRIEFKDTERSGKAAMSIDGEAFTDFVAGGDSTDEIEKESGETHVLEIKWNTVCTQILDLTTGCDPTAATIATVSETVDIGVDDGTGDNNEPVSGLPIKITLVVPPDGGSAGSGADSVGNCASETGGPATRGLCNWVAYPGDEKIFLEELLAEDNFPTSHGSQIKRIMVMFSDETFDKATLNPAESFAAGDVEFIDVDAGSSADEPDISNATVEGLTNGTTYFFRLALLDEANNITDITDDLAYTDNKMVPDPSVCAATTTDPPQNVFACPVTAKPDEVLGLLAEDFNCFVTTAAYGSTFADKVVDFRRFRRKFMLGNSFGRQVNLWYYQVGPYLTHPMKDNDFLKTVARIFLFPLWAFAKISLKYGLIEATLFSFGGVSLIIAGLFLIIRYIRRSRTDIHLL